VFIAVDGIDGAGKTTLVLKLSDLLAPLNPLLTKEPTSLSEWGRALKDSASQGRLAREVELDYFHKDRVHHVNTRIKPALKSGRPVISDRYVDSTLAFQASTPEEAEQLYRSFVSEILVPDLTLILDCPVEKGLARIREGRGELSKFENIETLKKAGRIYESRRGPNYAHIDASGTADQTLEQACSAIVARFPQLRSLLNNHCGHKEPPRSAIA
jgi:dTMP kinase